MGRIVLLKPVLSDRDAPQVWVKDPAFDLLPSYSFGQRSNGVPGPRRKQIVLSTGYIASSMIDSNVSR